MKKFEFLCSARCVLSAWQRKRFNSILFKINSRPYLLKIATRLLFSKRSATPSLTQIDGEKEEKNFI